MFAKIKFESEMSVVETARFFGCSPCAILAVNKCNEVELYGREILVPIATPHMVRSLPYIFRKSPDGRIQKMLLP